MANTLITPTQLLNEAGRLFHQKAKFIGSVNRQYDDKFAQSGAKVGASISLRDRNAFTVTDGATMQVQNVTETYQTLTIDKRKHIAMDFTSQDLTLTIDEFSPRYIEPAVAKLVSAIEADAINALGNKVWNVIDNDAAAFSYLNVAQAKQMLDENLAPEDGRKLLLCPTHATKYLDASKGFYNPASKLGGQYDSGIVKDFTGFDIGATTQLTAHQTGTAVATTGYTVNTTTGGSTGVITLAAGSTTFKEGDVVTAAGCFEVHPETKVSYGRLKQFVVREDYAGGAGDLKISPTLVTTGAKQNCSAYPTNGGNVVKVGVAAVASATMIESLAYHPDAFIFATVDLEDMAKYGGWGARKNMDGVSMRLWRQGDITNDSAPCRLDVLYGYMARYPQLACRIHADG